MYVRVRNNENTPCLILFLTILSKLKGQTGFSIGAHGFRKYPILSGIKESAFTVVSVLLIFFSVFLIPHLFLPSQLSALAQQNCKFDIFSKITCETGKHHRESTSRGASLYLNNESEFLCSLEDQPQNFTAEKTIFPSGSLTLQYHICY